MAPPNNVTIPEPCLRPVIVLETPIPGLGLRASFDQHKILFLALVHIESDTAATFTAHHSRNLLRTAAGGIQIGTVVYLLAEGEAERFFQWLRTGEAYLGGVN